MLIKKTLLLARADISVSDDGAGGFEGYASVFGGVDSYGDTIAPGAFADTLKSNGLPKMFFNHAWDLPIGKYLSAEEDDIGLRVRGEYTPGIELAGNVRAAMKHGTVDGLSIAGYVAKGDFSDDGETRVIHRWTHLVEVSPVAFPADGAARVDSSSVKSAVTEAIAEIETIRDVERFLRDAGGLSKSAATTLVARLKSVFSAVGDPGDMITANSEFAALAARIKRLSERIA